MKIYAIADLHLDSTGDKKMDIFGESWINHEERVLDNIRNSVGEEDILLLPGDHSWGLRLKEAYLDLKKIDDLPGTKYLGKGNHDYWWATKSKLDQLNLSTLNFVQTNSYRVGSVGIFGTRGWMPKDSEEFKENDLKVFEREINRLRMSLESLKQEKLEKRIVMLHYPPFNFVDGRPNEFVDIMMEYGVDICVYGHLHADGHQFAKEGNIAGIEFFLVACDYLNLQPKLICEV